MKVSNTLVTLLLAAVVAGTIGCTEGQVSGQAGSGSGDGGGGTTTTTTASDVRAIVTTGPSYQFNASSAGDLDIEVDPTTRLPAIVYVDRSSPFSNTAALGGLKYAYMDQYGNWNIEVVDVNYGTTGVATCGTINSYCIGAPNGASSFAKVADLAFTSSGLPAIAYAYGASAGTPGGTKQVRYATRSASGTWSVEVAQSWTIGGLYNSINTIANIEPLRGVKLKFDPSDTLNRPHMIYGFLTNLQSSTVTPSPSSLRYVHRNNSGTWYESDLFTLSPAGTSAGSMAANAGWKEGDFEICPATYSSSSANTLRILGVASIASTVMGTAMTASTVAPAFFEFKVSTASGTAQNVSRVQIFGGPNSCGTGTQSCVSTGIGGFSTAAGAAGTLGSNMQIEIGIDNRPKIALNSQTNTWIFSLPAACTASATQDLTAAVWGAGLAAGPVSGASSSEGFFGLGYNLINTPSNTMALVVAASHSLWINARIGGYWENFSSVTASTVEPTYQGDHLSRIATAYDTSYGVAYVAYGRAPTYASTLTGSDVIVASTDSGSINGAGLSWTQEVVDQTAYVSSFNTMNSFPNLSAAKSSSGKVGVAFYYADPSLGNDQKLYFYSRGGTESAPTFGGSVVVNFIEGTSETSNPGMMPAATYDGNNQPAIAFYNGTIASQNLAVARTSNDGANWSVAVVDDTSAQVGQFPSIASVTVGSVKALGVAYYDLSNSSLKFARWASQGGWKRWKVDGDTGVTGTGCSTASSAGRYAKVKFTSAGKPVIFYERGSALYMAYSSEAITASNHATWTCVLAEDSLNAHAEGIDFVLDSNDYPHAAHLDLSSGIYRVRYVKAATAATSITSSSSFSRYNVDSTGLAGGGPFPLVKLTVPSIQVTSAGTVYIAYHSAGDKALNISSMASGGSSFSIYTRVDQVSTGSAQNAAGQFPAMLLNSSNLPLVFYRSNENWLRYFSKSN